MKALAPISGSLLLLLLAACDREQAKTTPPAKSIRTGATSPIEASSPLRPSAPSESERAERRAETLTEQIYRALDGELEALFHNALDETTPARRQELLTVLYEETRLRPPTVRLPLLLEIARAEDAHPSVRATIMAELGSTLQTDHGGSWGDWALALEQHLAETEGLIRVE